MISLSNIEYINEKFRVTLIEDQILNIKMNDFEIFEVEDLLEIRNWMKTSIGQKMLFKFFEFGNGSSISRGFREYAASEKGAVNTIGLAFLVSNFAQQITIDYYLKFNKPSYPTQAFYKRSEAIDWIKTFL